MSRTLLCVLALASCVAGAADEFRVVEALRVTGEIAIDGILAEGAWNAAPQNEGFTVLDMPEKAAEVRTRFTVLYDDANLYFGIQCDEPKPEGMKASETERDGKVFSDDCVEIMVDPVGDRIEYYHFAVNSLGTICDGQMRQAGVVRTEEWDCDVEAAAKVTGNLWFAEVRIPVVALGLTGASTGEWVVNVTRERRADGVELSTFAPMTGGFHQPSLYAILRLPGADFGRYLWEIKEPYEVSLLPNEAGQLIYRAKTHVTNGGPAFRFIMLRGVLGDSEGEWIKDGLDAGQSREYEFAVPVATQGQQSLRIELAERGDAQALLAVKSLWTEVTHNPLAVTMIRPWYRDCIYATQTLDELVFDVVAEVRPEELEGLTLRASLITATGEHGPALDVRSYGRIEEPAKERAAIRMPLEELPEGDYALVVQLVDVEARTAPYRTTKTIRKLPRVEHEWRIDERNVLLHNGEPVMPFGWFSIPAEKMDDPGHAYNLCQRYSSQYFSDEQVRGHLDEYVAAGTYTCVYPYPSNRMVSPASVWGRPLTDEDAEALRLRIRALKDHPGVFAWYMADEPELRPALRERCRRVYEVVAEEDPFHPCIMLNDTIAGIHKYRDGGDVLMPDPYPCFLTDGLAARPIERTSNFIKACAETARGRKAIWVTPQAFNYGDVGRKHQRGPTFTELRNQLCQAVVYGAKGFLWYTYSHVSNYPDLDIGMRRLSFEAADLKDAILSDPPADLEVRVEADKPEHLHVSARRVGDDLYVFAVSTATESQDARITLSPAPREERLYVVSEGRAVALREGGIIEDTFETYAAHIYTTNARVGGREALSVALEEIARADAARKKPGNLAFEDNGTTIEVSSKSRYSSTPNRVVDGVTGGMLWRDGTKKEFPDWLIVRWPEPVSIGRIVLYTRSIADCEIQVPEGDDWRRVAEVRGNSEERVEITLAEAARTDAIRVLITGLMADQEYSVIWEVEAYEE